MLNLNIVVENDNKDKKSVPVQKKQKFLEIHHVLVVQEKNTNIVMEELLKLNINFI